MLPVRLSPGYVSIYGAGSIQQIITGDANYRFGTINQVFDDFVGVEIGQSVLYNIKDTVPLNYINVPYYILPEEKIILVEDEVIPPP